MIPILWNHSFSVQIPEIDEQHRKLLDIFNKLNQAIIEGHEKEILMEILQELEDYTRYHFEFEESFIAANNLPGLEPHRTLHRRLIEELKDYREKFYRQRWGLSRSLNSFLRSWFLNHILTHDKKYALALHKKRETP